MVLIIGCKAAQKAKGDNTEKDEKYRLAKQITQKIKF
jgi:hypothetical protein